MVQDFNFQIPYIISNLQEKGYSRKEAFDLWYNSKTKARLEELNIYYASPSRIIWELELEMSNDIRWFNEPFDM